MSKKLACVIDFDHRYLAAITDELKGNYDVVLDQNHGHEAMGIIADRDVELVIFNADQSIDKLKSLIQSMGILSKNIPIVICSAILRSNDAVDLVRMGINDVVETPFDRGTLERRIQAIEHFQLGSLSKDGIEDDAVLTIQLYERIAIEKALKYCKGNRRAASEMIGIGEATLYRKIKEYNILE